MRRIAAGLATALALGVASAQDYPARAVHLIVPYTPGTGADILARLIGPRLAERWKVAVVTENKVGATGNIGTDFVAKSLPDGYTLLFTATSFGTNPALTRNLPFDPVKSFAPVVVAATSSVALIVHPELPAKTLRDFIALAKREPGKLHYSSPGNGGPQHLTMELLKLETGIDIVHVPYKGAGGALADVIGGHVDAMISALQTAAPHVHSGKVRMLVVMSAQRSSAFRDVPTAKEQGYPELEVETWYGVFAPAGTPREVVQKVNSEINAQLADPALKDLLAKQGMTPAGGTPERFAALVKQELARWTRVVAAAGIKAD